MRLEMRETRTDRLLESAFGPDIFIVGGAVRDKLCERFHRSPHQPRNRDYVVTGHDIHWVRERLGSLGELVEAGAGYPIWQLTVPGEATVGVALPQRNRSSASRARRETPGDPPSPREDPSSPREDPPSLREDQWSRDFRMNALAVQLSSAEVWEVPGAISDIREKRICALNGARSFTDDPLRLLRAAQFAGRLGFSIEEGTWNLMRDAAHLLDNRELAPAERIGEELSNMLLECARPSVGIRLLHEAGLLERVIPGLDAGAGVEQNQYHAYDVLGHNLATLDASRKTLESRWAALLHDIGKPAARSAQKVDYGYTFYHHEVIGADMAQQVLRDLRYSNEFVERVRSLVANHMYSADPSLSDRAIRRFINRIDPTLLDDQFHLRHCDKIGCGLPVEGALERNQSFQSRVYEILDREQPRSVRDLAIGGHEVFASMIAQGFKAAGTKPGPEVGLVLRRLREIVSDQPRLNTIGGLAEQVSEIIQQLKGGLDRDSAGGAS
jgi:putative nucleotidyltransferase with HDIG domain